MFVLIDASFSWSPVECKQALGTSLSLRERITYTSVGMNMYAVFRTLCFVIPVGYHPYK